MEFQLEERKFLLQNKCCKGKKQFTTVGVFKQLLVALNLINYFFNAINN